MIYEGEHTPHIYNIMKKSLLHTIVFFMSMTLLSYDNDIPKKNKQDVPAIRKITIMGDSYSTFEGWSNKDVAGNDNNYYVYYPYECTLTGVDCVEKTWWYMLGEKPGLELEISNSFSGSVISNTHYNGVDVTGTDISFLNRVGKNSNGVDYNGDPDVILILGGTNDCWAGVDLGDYVYKNWSAADLKCFRPAFSKLISSLMEHYPEATIYNITNDGADGFPEGLGRSYAKSMKRICRHYGVTNIELEDIEKVEGHPTYAGMQAICEQIYSVLK